MPSTHFFLLGNPLLPKIFPDFEKANQVQEVRPQVLLSRHYKLTWYQFAVAMIKERQKNYSNRNDILARLLEIHEKDPSILSFREIVAITTTNMYDNQFLLY